PLHGRGADLHSVGPSSEKKDFVERHDVADVAGELLDPDLVALRDLVLLAARLDHRIHGFGPLRLPRSALRVPLEEEARRRGGESAPGSARGAPAGNGTREYRWGPSLVKAKGGVSSGTALAWHRRAAC